MDMFISDILLVNIYRYDYLVNINNETHIIKIKRMYTGHEINTKRIKIPCKSFFYY